MPLDSVTRVIRCTEANAAQFLALVNGWPELKALVRELRSVPDLFPGLRAMHVTLTGAPKDIARGLPAFIEKSGPAGPGASDAT